MAFLDIQAPVEALSYRFGASNLLENYVLHEQV